MFKSNDGEVFDETIHFLIAAKENHDARMVSFDVD